jgi:hypothetical protein
MPPRSLKQGDGGLEMIAETSLFPNQTEAKA